MIISALLMGTGAFALSKAGSKLASDLVPELTGGAIERSIDIILDKIHPERKHEFMIAVAAALQIATKELLSLPEMWRDSDREIWRDLNRDAAKLLVQQSGASQKAIAEALLIGTVETLSDALENLVGPYFENRKARAPLALKQQLPAAFLHAFGQVMKDDRHEKAWKTFQRELAWAVHQHLISLENSNGRLLEQLQAMSEGDHLLPDLIQEFDKQAEKITSVLSLAITQDGDVTRSEIARSAADTARQLTVIAQAQNEELEKIGENIASVTQSLNTQPGISLEQVEAALDAYRSRIIRELEFVPYRGISGIGTGERVVELPIDDVFVVPLLLAEGQRVEDSERERALLDRMSTQDLSDEVRAMLEVELAEIANQRWKTHEQYSPFTLDEEGWQSFLQWRSLPQNDSWQPLTVAEALSGNHHCVVLGAPGSGKSTLLRWLALMCARDVASPEHLALRAWLFGASEVAPNKDMPVLISLAAFAKDLETHPNLSLYLYVKEHLTAYTSSDLAPLDLIAAFEHCFTQGRCWILLDGVDEIAQSTQRATIVKRIDSFLHGCGQNRCLITSRPHGYNRVAGRVTHLYLDNFVPPQVAEFVVKWHLALEVWQHPVNPSPERAVNEATQLLNEISDNQNVRALATNPLMLIIMALIHREKKRLPERRVELYDAAINTLITTWNNWRSSSRYDEGGIALSPGQLRRVLGRVALWSRRDKSTGVLPRGELRRHVVQALEELGQEDTELEATADSYLNMAVQQAGVLEERVPGVFAFWHPVFEEFLAAREISTPTAKVTERLLPLRHDPRWREVILLAVGCIGVLHDDTETANELVRSIANAEPDVTEPLLHRHLRLAVACLRENPSLDRSIVRNLLVQLAHVLTRQPFEPMGGDFCDTVNAFQELVPDDELITALEGLNSVDHTRGRIRAAVFLLLANAAVTNARARRLCMDALEQTTSKEYMEKDAPARFYAAIGAARAGDITPSVLAMLVWSNQPIENVSNVVELLGLTAGPKHVGASQRDRRLAAIHALLTHRTGDANESQQRAAGDDQVVDTLTSMNGRLAAALILLYSGEKSPEVWSVLMEALSPEHDSDGAIFDAAQAALRFECEDVMQTLTIQRMALAAFRRWLQHPLPERRLHSAKVLLEYIEKWQQQYESNPVPEAFMLEHGTDDPFEATYQQRRHETCLECFECLASCLHSPNLDTRLIAANTLLDYDHLDSVAQAVALWMQEESDDVPRFFAQPLVARIAQHNEQGKSLVVSWLGGEDDWLKALASGALIGDTELSEKVFEARRCCLSSPHDEIRSAVAGSLAMLSFIERKSLPRDVEDALRSCLGSPLSDASRNAAAALYRFEQKDEGVMGHIGEYLFTQNIAERFGTLNAYRETCAEESIIQQFLDALGMNSVSARNACDNVRTGASLTNQDQEELLGLIERQPDEGHDRYALRRFFFDWLWWTLEARQGV